jgi:thioesterase domain-containing protein
MADTAQREARAVIQDTLWTRIPITQALGIEVLQIDEQKAVLRAPLRLNHNHMGSAFGGSLQVVLVSSAYAWLFHWIESRYAVGEVRLLLQRSTVEYLRPVTIDLVAECEAPSASELALFVKTLDSKKRARLSLVARISGNCQLNAEFVAHL